MCCLFDIIYCLKCLVLIWIKTTSTVLHSVYQSICSLAGQPYWCVHMLWLCFSADVMFLFPTQPVKPYCHVHILWLCFSASSRPVKPYCLVHKLWLCFSATVVVFQCWCGGSISWLVTQPGKPYCHVHMLWLCFNADVVFLFPSQSPSQWSPLSCAHAVFVFQCWRGVFISWPVTPVSRTSCTLSSCMNSRLPGIFTLAPFLSLSMACMKKCRWKVLLFIVLGSVFVYLCSGLSGWEETFSYTGCNMDSCSVPFLNILGVRWCMLFYIDKCIPLGEGMARVKHG